MDITADFMFSYSYCPSSDKCVADQWNKFNSWCNEPWIKGYMLDIELDCAGKIVEPCISFASAQINEAQETQASKTLAANEICEVYVDASVYIAHVEFRGKGSDDSEIGILYNGAGPTDIIEVAQGETVRISVFNAAPEGDQVEFEYVFTGATRVAATVAAASSMLYLF